MLTTADALIAERVLRLRQHGMSVNGHAQHAFRSRSERVTHYFVVMLSASRAFASSL